MAKKNKLSTPDWITEGFDSKADWEKSHGVSEKKGHPRVYPETFSKKGLQGAKTFKIRECPKCGSDDVGLVLSNIDSEEAGSTGKQWECKKCKWRGRDIVEKELSEEEFMKYLDEKGEEVS